MDRCRTILSRPHQTKKRIINGIQVCQMVVPCLPKTSSCPPFYCAACQYAKQSQSSSDTIQSKKIRPDNEGSLTAGDFAPGQVVSCDHYLSSTRGRLPHTRGKEQESSKLVGGTIFVDHASLYVVLSLIHI